MASSSPTRDQTLDPLHWKKRVSDTGHPGEPYKVILNLASYLILLK